MVSYGLHDDFLRSVDILPAAISRMILPTLAASPTFPNRDSILCPLLILAAPFQKFVAPAPLEQAAGTPSLPAALSYVEQRRIFKQIIVKCVLQLLLIETTHELLQNDEVYNTIPAEHLLRFMGVLDDSWRFARKFNADRDLRMKLWKVGTLWLGVTARTAELIA